MYLTGDDVTAHAGKLSFRRYTGFACEVSRSAPQLRAAPLRSASPRSSPLRFAGSGAEQRGEEWGWNGTEPSGAEQIRAERSRTERRGAERLLGRNMYIFTEVNTA